MMHKTIGFPGRYVQGPDCIRELPALLTELKCSRPVVIVDALVRGSVWNAVSEMLPISGLQTLEFPGECTAAVIADLTAQADTLGADCIIAVGGGKTIDVGKGVALQRDARLVIVPTIASNDSPTSRLIVIYDDAHKVCEVRMMARNPDVVLVDTVIVARAPVRFFAAGLGDALSKQAEVMQCHLAGGKNFFGTPSLPTARLLADVCYRTIVEFGERALHRVASFHAPDEDVERVVEASVLLSGLGFESGGLSLAHALTRGFSAHPVMHKFLHGEIVAFGSIVQLIAQQTSRTEIQTHAALTMRLGLPVCFADFGVPAPSLAEVEEIAALTCLAPYIGNITPPADRQSVIAALLAADALGQSLRRQG